MRTLIPIFCIVALYAGAAYAIPAANASPVSNSYLTLASFAMQFLIIPAVGWIVSLNRRIAAQSRDIEMLNVRLRHNEAYTKASQEALASSMNQVLRSLEKLTDRMDRMHERNR